MSVKNPDIFPVRTDLWASLLDFTTIFFKLRTGREFKISTPQNRESHQVVIARALTDLLLGKTTQLNINIPPRHGKTELVLHFIAWALARNPESNFIYVSHTHTLAAKHTGIIRDIIALPQYKKIFGIAISDDTGAKDNFQIVYTAPNGQIRKGGSILAIGAGGSIAGQGAGVKGVFDRFSGALIIDDLVDLDDFLSDTVREGRNEWYVGTAESRRNNGLQTPVINIQQRGHEHDFAGFIMEGGTSGRWEHLVIPALDSQNNALDPDLYTSAQYLEMKRINPYNFHSRYQQQPLPPGGSVFKKEDFCLMDEEPKMLSTFLTVDTAETAKEYNDRTVFSFWGVYRIVQNYIPTNLIGLHWIDCVELMIEPKDLQNALLSFYGDCLRYKMPPSFIAIERKSTGVTLSSVLKEIRGLNIRDVERTAASRSKGERYGEMQPYFAEKRISLPRNGKHTNMCIDHMIKITRNDAHRRDDVCFIAGTKIATLFGFKNIENVTTKDFIITPFGLGKVVASGLTRKANIVSNMGLTGTSEHPVYYGNKFERLNTVCDADKISLLSFNELIKWRYLKLLNLTESNIKLQDREDIILASQAIVKKEKVLKDFMSRFMSFIVEKKLRKAMWFIIRMVIVLITTTTIWNVFLISNIWRCMLNKEKTGFLHLKNCGICKKLESLLKNGMLAKKVKNGIKKMRLTALTNQENLLAANAGELLSQNVVMPNIVVENVSRQETQKMPELGERQNVYNLTVKDYGVYYANNVLVSNCDTAYDAVKIALIDKLIGNLYVEAQSNKTKEYAKSIYDYQSQIAQSRSKNIWL